MKQNQFAKLVNVSPSYISRLIKNNKLSTLKNGEINEHVGLLEFTLLKCDNKKTDLILSDINKLCERVINIAT